MFLCAHFVWKVPQLECTGNLRGRPGSPGSVGWRCAATCLIPQAVQTKNASDLVQWIFNQSVCVCSVCCILMQKEYYKTVWISTCAEIAVVSTAQHIEREHQLEWAVSGTCQKSIRESLATKKTPESSSAKATWVEHRFEQRFEHRRIICISSLVH